MSLYDKMRQNDPTGKTDNAAKEESYPTASNTRNLIFILKDGKYHFLNYAYLVSGEYSPDASLITLIYTTHTVTIKGETLEPLFEALVSHLPRIIRCMDERYNDTVNDGDYTVNDIEIITAK